MEHSLIGLTLNNRYEITKQLGVGGMGVVLQAHDHFLDRQVAVKIIQPRHALAPAAMDAFIHEARIIARLEHPYILTVYDLGIHPVMNGNLLYFIMQVASGGTLAARLEKGPMSLAETQRIMIAVCDALDYAHSQGIIHLDLKPLNILFDARNTPLVADFGMSKILQNATKVKADTRVGTLAYMSPEQLFGAQAGPYSDVYSLGITLYEMLTGELPRREWNGDVHLGNPLAGDILRVIQKATQSDPNRRYKRASELSETLAALMVPRITEDDRARKIASQHTFSSKQVASPASFDEAEMQALELQRQFQLGNLSKDEYQQQFRSLMLRDEQGRWWGLDSRSQWHFHDGSKWTAGKPPSRVAAVHSKFSESDRLIAELENPDVSHLRRAEIGETLAKIGDNRTGVGLQRNETGPRRPSIEWCEVPGGKVEIVDGAGTFTVLPLHISKYPITFVQFRAFEDDSIGPFMNKWWEHLARPKHSHYMQGLTQLAQPINYPCQVDWYDAVAFCRWLSAMLGYEIRLPTEWEWQQAATGANPLNRYPWGSDWNDRYANTEEALLRRSTAVGIYPQGISATGTFDMVGNVWEWCLNEFDILSNIDISGNAKRSIRGGAWNTSHEMACCTFRQGSSPDKTFGFRIVCGNPPVTKPLEGSQAISVSSPNVYHHSTPSRTNEVTTRLLADLKNDNISHNRRMQIGKELAELGDPRSGVGLRPDGLPDISWCQVPGGTVKLENYVGESIGVARVEPFLISRYPITFVQFQAFLTAPDGFELGQWWEDFPLSFKKQQIEKQTVELNNYPRERVSWYQATAFCRWLTNKLPLICQEIQPAKKRDKSIRLPTIFEWQQAATGGDHTYRYPWGPTWEENRANTLEADLGQAVAVGMYPQGRSPVGALDMVGNVWEWCLSKIDNPFDNRVVDSLIDPTLDDGSPTERSRVLRGGSWAYDRKYARNTCGCGTANSPEQRGGKMGFGFRIVCAGTTPRKVY